MGHQLDLDELLESGQVGSVLCRLARDSLTGLLFIENEEVGGGIFSFRGGRPVFVEDLGDGPSVPDQMLSQGLVDQAQYAQIAERVANALVESEDVAFCQGAVELGILEQSQVDSLMRSRSRARLIQAIGWRDCAMEVDDDPDGLAGILEYPEDVGAIVYMGVRTFFEDEQVREVVGSQSRYARLLVPEEIVGGFFAFDDEETALLRALRPDRAIDDVLQQGGADPLDGWQLIAMLTMAGMVELAPEPFPAAASQEAPRPPSRPAVAQEVVFTSREAVRPPAAEQPAARVARAPSPAAVPTRRSADQLPPPESRPAPTRPEPERRDSIAARMKAKRRRPRKLGAALKRLDRELKGRRPASMPQRRPSVAQPEPAKPSAPTGDAGGGAAKKKADRAAVKALMRMRQAQKTSALHSGKVTPNASQQDGGGATFAQAQAALRDQRFDKAHDILKELVAADPDDALHTAYMHWAALRAKRATEDDIKELRKHLRDLATDDLHKGFAAYALGHLALEEKREEQAEKYFRKAIELDRNNKDAERHLRILELKRKTAAGERNNKIFGIEINRKK